MLKLIAVVSIVFCAVLNFEDVIWGGQVNKVSGYIFIIFILIWFIIIYLARNNISTLKMFLIMWSISVITSISLILATLNIVSGDWYITIVYVFIFNIALDGINYWAGYNNLIIESIQLLISMVFLFMTLIFFIKERKKQ